MLEEYEQRITSEYKEDGVLNNIFKKLPLNKFNRRYYVYLRDADHMQKPRHMVRNLILHHKFVNAISHKEHPRGSVPCTIDAVKKLFASNAFTFCNPVDFLSVECKATDFWIIKTFIEQCKELNISLPNVVVVRYNYILGPQKSLVVPYTTNKNNNDINYTGASLQAYNNILKDYVFIGCLKYALAGFFVKRDLIVSQSLQRDPLFQEANVDHAFAYPNVIYGMTTRWPQVEKKFWIQIK